jgi:hypothetical protein
MRVFPILNAALKLKNKESELHVGDFDCLKSFALRLFQRMFLLFLFYLVEVLVS